MSCGNSSCSSISAARGASFSSHRSRTILRNCCSSSGSVKSSLTAWPPSRGTLYGPPGEADRANLSRDRPPDGRFLEKLPESSSNPPPGGASQEEKPGLRGAAEDQCVALAAAAAERGTAVLRAAALHLQRR